MNKTKSEKYDIHPHTIEKKSIEDENYKEMYDFHRLIKVKEDAERRENIKIGNRKKNKLR